MTFNEVNDFVLKDPVDYSEVGNICTKFKCGKAYDAVGLCYEHVKYAGPSVIKALTKLCNAIIDLEVYPEEFKKGLIIPLFKGGDRDPLIRNDYRGITIQGVLCKVFETVIYERAEGFIKQKMSISPTQAACQKGFSSIDTSFLVHETIASRIENNLPIFIVFLDQKKAFDALWVNGLFYTPRIVHLLQIWAGWIFLV